MSDADSAVGQQFDPKALRDQLDYLESERRQQYDGFPFWYTRDLVAGRAAYHGW